LLKNKCWRKDRRIDWLWTESSKQKLPKKWNFWLRFLIRTWWKVLGIFKWCIDLIEKWLNWLLNMKWRVKIETRSGFNSLTKTMSFVFYMRSHIFMSKLSSMEIMKLIKMKINFEWLKLSKRIVCENSKMCEEKFRKFINWRWKSSHKNSWSKMSEK